MATVSITMVRTVKGAAVGQVVGPPGMEKTFTQADVDATPSRITTETLVMDSAALSALGINTGTVQVHLNAQELAAAYTKAELLAALGAQA